jgi:hypothetical protein
MYDNDKIGDCGLAAPGHQIQSWSFFGNGNLFTPEPEAIIEAYSAVSGYDPKTGANDTGVVLQDVLSYWRKTGIGGNTITVFASVDVSQPDEIDAAIEAFGSLLVGVNLPKTAAKQLDDGQPWDYVRGSGDGAPGSWGGHAIHVGAFDRVHGVRACTTWGAIQLMSDSFWKHYAFEAWVAVSTLWVDTNKDGIGAIDLRSLGQAFVDLVPGASNPFPDVPNPVVDMKAKTEADLLPEAQAWVGRKWHTTSANRSLRAVLEPWIGARI